MKNKLMSLIRCSQMVAINMIKFKTNHKGLNSIVFEDGEEKYLSDDDCGSLLQQLKENM